MPASASPAAAAASAPLSVVTRNISPAPSQSEAVRIGVCTYLKPSEAKKACVAWASSERTRETAPKRLLRGRRCAIERRNSSECFFFCRGYSSAGHAPTSSTDDALTSSTCPLPLEATTSPITETAAPVLSSSITVSYDCMSPAATTCMPLRLEPSFTSTKENAFWERTVRTQPLSNTVLPIAFSPSSSSFATFLRRKVAAPAGGAGVSAATEQRTRLLKRRPVLETPERSSGCDATHMDLLVATFNAEHFCSNANMVTRWQHPRMCETGWLWWGREPAPR